MDSAAEFYQQHLDRVSRSFAFCIAQLTSPLREWVGLSYLLCRVVDTVEDAAWPAPEAQFDAFARFDRALLDEAGVAELEQWADAFPSDVNLDERTLLEVAPRLMRDYHQLPLPVRQILRERIYSMSQGMQHFCRGKVEGSLYLRSLSEVNQYCFFVAGVVGELLTKLLARVEPRLEVTQGLLLHAHHFGLFLQKVNLLKDQVGDEQVGRHLIPSRELVETSARENASNALEFLLALPAEQSEFRRFCAWSLFLGLEALVVARRSLNEQKILKVSRTRLQEVLASVEGALSDSGHLRQLFTSFTSAIGWDALPGQRIPPEKSVPEWLVRFYQGSLETPKLRELGVAVPS